MIWYGRKLCDNYRFASSNTLDQFPTMHQEDVEVNYNNDKLVTESIRESILNSFELHSTSFVETGHIKSVADGVVIANGLRNAFVGEVVKFVSDEHGIVLNLEKSIVKIIVFGNGLKLRPGQLVYRTSNLVNIVASTTQLGQVISPLGKHIMSMNPFFDESNNFGDAEISQQRIVDVKAPGIIFR